MREVRVCPKCGKVFYDYPALSRRDNETEICPACGMQEALEDYEKWRKAHEMGRDAKQGI